MALLSAQLNPARLFLFSPPPSAFRLAAAAAAANSGLNQGITVAKSSCLFLCRGTASSYHDSDDNGDELVSYFNYEDKEEDEYEYEEEEEDEVESEDDELFYDDLSDSDEDDSDEPSVKKNSKSSEPSSKEGKERLRIEEHKVIRDRSANGKKDSGLFIDIYDENVSKKKLNSSKMDLLDLGSKAKLKNEKYSKVLFEKLQEDFNFDDKWFPLIDYLTQFGLKESHFVSMYERHMRCFETRPASAREKLTLLQTVGVRTEDIKRILVRQPQILEYSVSNLYLHVEFLVTIGVPNSKLGQIITSAPSFFSYSIDRSLRPTVRYLIEEVGIKEGDVGKVVQLSPQILVQKIDKSWKSRFFFLSRELGAPKYSVVKMVTRHPQLLHYSIKDGILPRINFLRSIGMSDSDILKVVTNLAQVLSLSLEGNLKPKYNYLVNELKNEVNSLAKYPIYLSLSLEQRIRPRHCYLLSLKKAPRKGPFPLGSLMPSDVSFCQQWAGTSLDKYLDFRERLSVSELEKRYEKRKGLQIKKSVKSGFW